MCTHDKYQEVKAGLGTGKQNKRSQRLKTQPRSYNTGMGVKVLLSQQIHRTWTVEPVPTMEEITPMLQKSKVCKKFNVHQLTVFLLRALIPLSGLGIQPPGDFHSTTLDSITLRLRQSSQEMSIMLKHWQVGHRVPESLAHRGELTFCPQHSCFSLILGIQPCRVMIFLESSVWLFWKQHSCIPAQTRRAASLSLYLSVPLLPFPILTTPSFSVAFPSPLLHRVHVFLI